MRHYVACSAYLVGRKVHRTGPDSEQNVTFFTIDCLVVVSDISFFVRHYLIRSGDNWIFCAETGSDDPRIQSGRLTFWRLNALTSWREYPWGANSETGRTGRFYVFSDVFYLFILVWAEGTGKFSGKVRVAECCQLFSPRPLWGGFIVNSKREKLNLIPPMKAKQEWQMSWKDITSGMPTCANSPWSLPSCFRIC